MVGGSSALYLARSPCVPLFCTLFNRGGNRRAFRLPGKGRDHFHCTVEPSPGHIRCRICTESIRVLQSFVLDLSVKLNNLQLHYIVVLSSLELGLQHGYNRYIT